MSGPPRSRVVACLNNSVFRRSIVARRRCRKTGTGRMDDVSPDVVSPRPTWRPDRSSRFPAFCFPRCRTCRSIFASGTVFFSRWRRKSTHSGERVFRVGCIHDAARDSGLWGLSSSLSLASLPWKREGCSPVATRSGCERILRSLSHGAGSTLNTLPGNLTGRVRQIETDFLEHLPRDHTT